MINEYSAFKGREYTVRSDENWFGLTEFKMPLDAIRSTF